MKEKKWFYQILKENLEKICQIVGGERYQRNLVIPWSWNIDVGTKRMYNLIVKGKPMHWGADSDCPMGDGIFTTREKFLHVTDGSFGQCADYKIAGNDTTS